MAGKTSFEFWNSRPFLVNNTFHMDCHNVTFHIVQIEFFDAAGKSTALLKNEKISMKRFDATLTKVLIVLATKNPHPYALRH